MMVAPANIGRDPSAPALTSFDVLQASGTVLHAHHQRLLTGDTLSTTRDLADFVHCLCNLYACHPTMIETALGRVGAGGQRDWMMQSVTAFEHERHFLVSLTAAVGPLPSTSGAAQTENALKSQRHAIETLGRSERNGCALGSAAALVADWSAMRLLLNRVAERQGLDEPECSLPDDGAGKALAQTVDGMAQSRAFAFGAEQLLLQHRGLFDLLEARAAARDKVDGLA
ncbi:DUF6975 family protein [Sphingomicrobium arenosum]|uniref:DUF6975 family protein n=1 Tax=Sphingomicrobium arenosum TaxID=2233861 RepID=UPI00223F3671|nr:hypothetical protein [Sphingomicrobium arenosum]